MFGIGRNIVSITSWGKWTAGLTLVSDSVTKLAGRALSTMRGGNSSESGSRGSSV